MTNLFGEDVSEEPTHPEDWVKWFNATYQRAFRCVKPLKTAIRRLTDAGYTQADLQLVTRFLHFQWSDSDNRDVRSNMLRYFVPESIMRSGKFHGRLDQAREWERRFAPSPRPRVVPVALRPAPPDVVPAGELEGFGSQLAARIKGGG